MPEREAFMNILIVGGGGREHAVVWKLALSNKVDKLYCAPGNGGIGELAKCHDVGATDIPSMVALAKELKVGLVAVIPDDPLALGMVDALEEAGIPAFGPNKAAAEIEGSKVFAKELMRKYHIPTADYAVFDDVEQAREYIKSHTYPLVVKADGLALGKGVIICQDQKEADAALDTIMVDKKFGASGDRVVIEAFITGPEVSILAFADGKTVLPMVSAQDHKRAYDGDRGPNTGGMGTFSPAPQYTPEVADEVTRTIIRPTIEAMAAEGRPFKGVLYFGLMLTTDGPKVLEYNARFGDPEAQVVLPRLETDLLEIFLAIMEERLSEIILKWKDDAAVCVVLASGGYPISYQKGYPITGLGTFSGRDDLMVFHAGTRKVDGQYVTSGGRVLGLTALAPTLDAAIEKAYANLGAIDFKDKQYRNDIGRKE
jgi:phosphoribosylamine--glycine ligase